MLRLQIIALLLCPPLGLLASGRRVAGVVLLACMVAAIWFVWPLAAAAYLSAWLIGIHDVRQIKTA